jgi:hypothetical protein
MLAVVVGTSIAGLAWLSWYWGGTDALLAAVLLVTMVGMAFVARSVVQSERRMRTELRQAVRREAVRNEAFRGQMSAELRTAIARFTGEVKNIKSDIKGFRSAVDSLDKAIAQVDARGRKHVSGSVSQMEARLVAQIERLRLPGEQAEALLRAIKGGYTRVEKELDRQLTSLERAHRATLRQFKHLPAEMDALLQVHRRSQLNDPLPLMGGWALSPRALLQAIDLVTMPEVELAVECGSGTSTVFLARALQLKGSGKLIALEHMQEFCESTNQALKQHGLEHVAEVRHAPLVEVQIGESSYLWYEGSTIDDVHDVDLLIVDGPPGHIGSRARFPAFPILRERLASSAVLFVDDLQRPDEQAAVDAWLESGGLSEVSASSGEQAILRYARERPA